MVKHTQRTRTDDELKNLQRQLREGERKVKRAEDITQIEFEKRKIRKQLLLLKNPRKVALARRLGRGFKITGKKVGKALIKQGKLISEQQERDRRLSTAREKTLSRPVKIRKSKKKKGSNPNVFDPFELNF
ncbi:hypothetical protein LCGC14_2004820 [marine sediment metagenome]|uniref:Uncharacterized protein n=1 Tax=marine sediment metagenome TaxID=412755 RepID=A0A0F9FPS1_9ZZZZ